MKLIEKGKNNWYLVNDEKETFLDLSQRNGCCPFTRAVIVSIKSLTDDEEIISSIFQIFDHHSITDFNNFETKSHANYKIREHKKALVTAINLFDGEVKDFVITCLIQDVLEVWNGSPAWSTFRLQFRKEVKPKLEALRPIFYDYNSLQQTLSTDEGNTKSDQIDFQNKFDKVKPIDVFNHFKAGLVKNGYLTPQELHLFLKAAFENKEIPETLLKIKNAPKKTTIEAVFYNYYKNVAGKPHRKQPQYAALLGDYFEGYKTKTIITNFSKSVY